MKRTTIKTVFITLISLSIVATSCKKDESNPINDTTASQDDREFLSLKRIKLS